MPRMLSGVEKHHDSTRERPNGSERAKERGAAPDAVLLVELLPSEACATAKRVVHT